MQVARKHVPAPIAVGGDPLPCLNLLDGEGEPMRPYPALFVIGIDARRFEGRREFTRLLRPHFRNVKGIPTSVSHIIVVVQHDRGVAAPWMLAAVHRWVLSIHRRVQRARGIDADVAALLVDWRDDPRLIEERIAELSRRPPGVNPAAVLTADEVRGQTIAQASTYDFI
jgi:hypothetical protein